ncbi:MAG: Sensor protein of zinc sigma-54-dependent two-component system [Myxococcales bacterium]|nr:Sensor protein of zinc sigma-54-dependent two-component system [Myxococcales bacterium]
MVRISTSRWLKVAMLGVVAGVFTLAYVDLRREQTRALEDFSADQQALARALAATVAARIDTVFDQVAALATVDAAAAARQSRALLAGRSFYREVDLVDDKGALDAIAAPNAGALMDASTSLTTARRELLAEARDGEAPLVSAPLRRSASARERLRMFVARRGPRAAVVLVDGDSFFDGAQPSAPAPTRWLVVDEARRWIELSPSATEVTAWRTDAQPPSPEVGELLVRMMTGGHGTLLLGRSAAAALGLEPRTAVAAYAPVPLRSSRPWAVGLVVSAMRVRDRARFAAWRLGAATGLTALFVALFGLFAARQQRRSHGLASALRLAEATAALRERSEKLVEAVPLGVLALDRDQRVTAVNPFLADRGVERGVSLHQALPGAIADEISTLEALVRDARRTRQATTRHGLRVHLGGDEPRDVDAYAVPLDRPLPDVDCFLVVHDRTEIRILERNLVRAEKLATIGTLAAGVAHEVGTPLGIISGRAEQLLNRLPDGGAGEGMRRPLTSIVTQVEKVSTTIRQLLDFARLRPVEAAAVTPAMALGQAAALLEHRFRHAKVELAVDAPPAVPAVAGDPGQLEQVFVNLLINACDACAAGGHVTARARPRGDGIAFEIADDGAGIAPEHLTAVLDPFFTTKKRGHGTGLGLTIAADIVKNHGGTLEIDSTLGAGTTVRVVLPVARPSGPATT